MHLTNVTYFLFLLQYIQVCVAHPGQLPARLEKLVRTLILIAYVKHKEESMLFYNLSNSMNKGYSV